MVWYLNQIIKIFDSPSQSYGFSQYGHSQSLSDSQANAWACITQYNPFGFYGHSQRVLYNNFFTLNHDSQRYYKMQFGLVSPNLSDLVIMVTVSQILVQHNFRVNKPLVEPLIHDDTTRLIVIWTLLPLSLFVIYLVMRYFNNE